MPVECCWFVCPSCCCTAWLIAFFILQGLLEDHNVREYDQSVVSSPQSLRQLPLHQLPVGTEQKLARKVKVLGAWANAKITTQSKTWSTHITLTIRPRGFALSESMP